ncbi:ATP-binding cassette domain-containing protein [Paenibacillus sp. GCM10027627]|uniref:ABC transporter ATP-binding protein n=1 Tax=unclassified Paenibacillus TaxID=185978 RepID=UPI003640E7AB
MLETVALRKVFKGKAVVDDLNLYMGEGEAVGLLGPNGAGKSTTIAMISSLMKPTGGDVRLHDKSVVNAPNAIRSMLGVVPQEIALYDHLSAYENLKFFGRLYKLRGEQLERKIKELLDLVGLTERKKDPVLAYSGGMKRRINIAAALLHDPKIVIMDEPTVGIDPQSRNHILEMVKSLNRQKGTSVLYTSHYMEEVEQLCDRVYIMDHGRIIASGTKAELLRILSDEQTVLMELSEPSAELVQDLRAMPSIKSVTETDEGVRLIVSKHIGILGEAVLAAERRSVKMSNINVHTPSLEDVFLHLTGRKLRD